MAATLTPSSSGDERDLAIELSHENPFVDIGMSFL
jgi:hypothetical protein